MLVSSEAGGTIQAWSYFRLFLCFRGVLNQKYVKNLISVHTDIFYADIFICTYCVCNTEKLDTDADNFNHICSDNGSDFASLHHNFQCLLMASEYSKVGVLQCWSRKYVDMKRDGAEGWPDSVLN